MKTIKEGESNQQQSEGKSWLSWTNDGPNATVNSLQVLLDWMTTPGNYNRFTGGAGQRGETKQTVAVEIQQKIKTAGIVANRSTDSIIHKIKELVSSYKEAHQLKRQTGQSTEAIYAVCKFFDVLDPILGSRPSIKPLITNKDIVDGKIVSETRATKNSSSPASSIQSDDTSVVAISTTVNSAPVTVSASATAKKNIENSVAKGKLRKKKDSEKVSLFFTLCLFLIPFHVTAQLLFFFF